VSGRDGTTLGRENRQADPCARRTHQDALWTATFSRDGRRVVTASEDMTARVWDVETGQTIFVLRRPDPEASSDASDAVGHVDAVLSAKFSNDGNRIVTASRDWSALVWDAATGAQIASMRGEEASTGHQRELRSAEFSPNGKLVVTSAGATVDATDDTARVWDAETGKQILILGEYRSDSYTRVKRAPEARIGHQGSVWSASFSSDGTRIVTAAADGTARLWDAQTGRQIAVFRGHSQDVVGAAFSPDGKRVVT